MNILLRLLALEALPNLAIVSNSAPRSKRSSGHAAVAHTVQEVKPTHAAVRLCGIHLASTRAPDELRPAANYPASGPRPLCSKSLPKATDWRASV